VASDLSFACVEAQSFKKMLYNLRHGVKIPSANTVKIDIIKTYNDNKNQIRQFLQVIINNLKNFIYKTYLY
jgi:hypothetical protein